MKPNVTRLDEREIHFQWRNETGSKRLVTKDLSRCVMLVTRATENFSPLTRVIPRPSA
ncbi:MAG: hypothetical protein QG622_1598 [Actinomycetota bacterium]|nr:hypothetical protein [Actinomycetota bacterium]